MPVSTPQYPHHNSHPDYSYSSLWVCNSISQLFMRLGTISVWVFTLCRVHWPCNCNTETRGTHDTPCQVRVSVRSGPAWELLHGKCYHNAASSPTPHSLTLAGQGGMNTPRYYSFPSPSPNPLSSFSPESAEWLKLPSVGAMTAGPGAGPEWTVNTAPRHGEART